MIIVKLKNEYNLRFSLQKFKNRENIDSFLYERYAFLSIFAMTEGIELK